MKNTFARRHLLAVASVAATLAISAAPAHAATLVVDNVENDGNTTWTTTGSLSQFPNFRTSPDSGLTAQAGLSFYAFSRNSTGSLSGTVRRTEGFGPTFLVAAGTYTLSMYIGEGNISRRTFTSLEPVLATTGGTEFSNKTVTTPYVDPNSTTTAEWVLVEVEYEIPGGSPLIGQEFTWGFDAAKNVSGGYYAAWDAATVDFVGIPEPSAAVLGSLGFLALLRRRR